MKFLIGVVCFVALTRQSVLGYPNDDPSKKDVGSHNVQSVNSFSDKIFNLIKTIYTTELDTDIALPKIDNVSFNLSETIDIIYERKNFTISFKNITFSTSTPVKQTYECRASEPSNVKNSLDDKSFAPYYKAIIEFRLKSKETSDVTNVTVYIPPKSNNNKETFNQIVLLELAMKNSYNGKQFRILQEIPPTKFARDTDTIKNQYTKLASLTCSQIEKEDIFNFVVTNFSASSTQTTLDFDLDPVEVKSSNKTKTIYFFNHMLGHIYNISAFDVTLRGAYGKNNSQGVYEKTHFEYTIDSLRIEVIFASEYNPYRPQFNQRPIGVYPDGFNKGTDVVRDKIIEAVVQELQIAFSSSLKNFYNEFEI